MGILVDARSERPPSLHRSGPSRPAPRPTTTRAFIPSTQARRRVVRPSPTPRSSSTSHRRVRTRTKSPRCGPDISSDPRVAGVMFHCAAIASHALREVGSSDAAPVAGCQGMSKGLNRSQFAEIGGQEGDAKVQQCPHHLPSISSSRDDPQTLDAAGALGGLLLRLRPVLRSCRIPPSCGACRSSPASSWPSKRCPAPAGGAVRGKPTKLAPPNAAAATGGESRAASTLLVAPALVRDLLLWAKHRRPHDDRTTRP
jgi:hypothetical protein